MKRKILALILGLTMALSLALCASAAAPYSSSPWATTSAPARSSHGATARYLCRQSDAVVDFQGYSRIRCSGPPTNPPNCCARPYGLPSCSVLLLLLSLVRCFGWLVALALSVRLLASRCLWLRRAGGWPRAAGLLLVLLVLSLSLRGWPCPPRLLVLLLSLLVSLLLRSGAPLGRVWWRGGPPALRRSSSRWG